MEYIYIGRIVNTHGIKGEIRILSDFDYKEKVFIINNCIYIGEEKRKEVINTYRKHKEYHMITLKGINDIKEVLKYKGEEVFIDKDNLKLNDNEYLDNDLINIEVYFNNKNIGTINDIKNNNGYKLFKISDKYIPYNSNFIENIDIKNNKITLKNVEELIK